MNEKLRMREDWVECSLAEVGDIFSGGTPKTREPAYWSDEISWISPSDLSNYTKKYIDKGKKSISALGLRKSSAKLFPKGTVLFSCRAPIGYTVIANKEMCTNQGFKSIHPYNEIDSEYVYYFLKSSKQEAEKVATGTTFKEISKTAFSKLKFPLPPFTEQKAIVKKLEALFSSLDSGIADLKKAQAQLKVYRQAVLKKAFEGELTKKELSYAIKNIKAGKSFRCDERPPQANEVGILKVSAVTWGKFQENESKTVTDPTRINPDYFVNAGDFLLSRANTIKLVGNSVIVKKISKQLMLSDKTLRITFHDNINPYYILYFLRSRLGRVQIENLSTGNQVSMRNIGQKRIKQIVVPFPSSLEEQHQIVKEIETRLSVCDQLEKDIADSLEKAKALRQSILKKAFEGKLLSEAALANCKADADYEPASVLLEKIKAEKKKK